MTIVKSNLCPTCGGPLDIDLDKQMYVCPFCGVTFDYEYFREDNVKNVASKAVNRNEYGSAKDAYDFILAKDPHDFEALRGLFLCETKWTDMNQMRTGSEVHVSADEPTLMNAIEKCRPEHKAYFVKVREALSELRHYRDLKTEAKSIREKKVAVEDTLHDIQHEIYLTTHLFSEICDELKKEDPRSIEAVIILTVVLPLFLIGYAIWQQAWAELIFAAVIFALAFGSYHLFKFIAAKYLTASMRPHQKELSELTEQFKAKNAEADQSISRYKALVQEFMDMDPAPSKANSN